MRYVFTTANVHDSKIGLVLLQNIKESNVLFSIVKTPLLKVSFSFRELIYET